MAAELHEQIAQKPLVPILLQGEVAAEVVNALLFGLEEEGIPSITGSTEEASICKASKEIAQLSRLNIGIGASAQEQLVVLHHRDLPTQEPLFQEMIGSASLADFRRLGANGARLVKGNPLLFKDERLDDPLPPPCTASPPPVEPALVERIVQEILKQLATRR